MVSNNRTNFKDANREINEALADGDRSKMQDKMNDMAIRENWRMCRIVETIGTDPEHVRRVKVVDSAGTTFDRHVEAIVPLKFSVSKD